MKFDIFERFRGAKKEAAPNLSEAISKFETDVFFEAKILFEKLGKANVKKYLNLAKLIFAGKQVRVGKDLTSFSSALQKLRDEGHDFGCARRATERAGIEATIVPETTTDSLFDLAKRVGVDTNIF